VARPGGGCGCALAAVAALGVFMGGIFAFTTLVLAGSRPLPGDASRFDPVASFPVVAALAGEGAQLQRMEATFVRADGTLELTAGYAPAPGVDYRFARPTAVPANAPPLGARSQPGDSWFVPVEVNAARPWRWRNVSRSSGGVRLRYQYVDLGLTPHGREPQSGTLEAAPPPACSFATLWKAALERGAPSDAVATIEYDASGFRFEVRGTAVSLRFDPDCRPLAAPR
jgi:hypothetical protein